MQIRNDYTSYSHAGYEHAHTHNITECLHEEQPKKQGGVSGSSKTERSSLSYQQQRQDTLEFFSMTMQETARMEERKKGFSFIKRFWEGLGKEDGGSLSQIPMAAKEAILSQVQGIIHSAQTAIHSMPQHKILRKMAQMPVAIKTEISTALKKFGKGSEAFLALSDEKMPSGGKNTSGGKKNQKGQVATRKEEKEIPMAELSNSHLMDSYSKKGIYCKLNENLTYQKPGNVKNTGSNKQQESGAE